MAAHVLTPPLPEGIPVPGGAVATALSPSDLRVLQHLIRRSKIGAAADHEGGWIRRSDIPKLVSSLGYGDEKIRNAITDLIRLGVLESRAPSPAARQSWNWGHEVRVTRSGALLVRSASDSSTSMLRIPPDVRRWRQTAIASKALGNPKRLRLLWALAKVPGGALPRRSTVRETYSAAEQSALGLDAEEVDSLVRLRHVPQLVEAGLICSIRRPDHTAIDIVEPLVLEAARAAIKAGLGEPETIAHVAALFGHPRRRELIEWLTDPHFHAQTQGVTHSNLRFGLGDWARQLAPALVRQGVLREEIERACGSVVSTTLENGDLTQRIVSPAIVVGMGAAGDQVVRHSYWLHPDFEVGGRHRRILDALERVLGAGADVQEERIADPGAVMEVLGNANFRRLAWSMLRARHSGGWVHRATLAAEHQLADSTVQKLTAAGVRTGLLVRIGGRRVMASDHLAEYFALALQGELGLEVGLRADESALGLALALHDQFVERHRRQFPMLRAAELPRGWAARGPRVFESSPVGPFIV